MKYLRGTLVAVALVWAAGACSMTELETGELIIEDLVIGTGLEVAAGDSVRIYYVLVRSDDEQICDLRTPCDEGCSPLGLNLDNTIEGFEQGMIGQREGGQRRIIVPPNLGYGLEPPRNQSCIRENEYLDFSIDLVEVIKP